ncbi:hypothetical protein KSP39_PZI004302 [Platanthera zijinensis]|uniref:Uncharacterized protein n=1 Tax=Platanthera zijinensis TaxID=2320716 RepID=A0AAP0BX21_9ASPA
MIPHRAAPSSQNFSHLPQSLQQSDSPCLKPPLPLRSISARAVHLYLIVDLKSPLKLKSSGGEESRDGEYVEESERLSNRNNCRASTRYSEYTSI